MSVLLLSSLAALPVNAAAGTIYESEGNNTYGTADVTYDDYDTYGALPTNDVADWWKISITAEGIANFYLGNIPSGCNYDLQLYDYTGTNKLAESLKTSNSSELVKCHVRAGETYYIRVFRASYPGTLSSANYQLRVKRYDLQTCKVFTSDQSHYNTRVVASSTLPLIRSMGFSAGEYLNNVAQSAVSALPTTDIFIASNMGYPGQIDFYQSALYGYKPSPSIADYSANALSNVKLIMFVAPGAGDVMNYYYGCLVDQAISKGVFNAIGWTDPLLKVDPLEAWTKHFLELCYEGQNLGEALNNTKSRALDQGYDEKINTVYHGSSRLYATVLG